MLSSILLILILFYTRNLDLVNGVCYGSDVNAFLFTKYNGNSSILLNNFQFNSIESLNTYYCKYSNCDTYILIHGFWASAKASWINELKNQLISRKDAYANVIIIDWSQGADWDFWNSLGYKKAIREIENTVCKTSEILVNLIKYNFLQVDKQTNLLPVHCIGHSLGAHTCGFLGKQLMETNNGKLRRITGLDPAGPCFEDQAKNNRLDKDDADYVDVIHTSKYFGIRKHIGHDDYYPNNGENQPGCKKEIPITWLTKCDEKSNSPAQNSSLASRAPLIDTNGCSHGRAYQYFIESIKHYGFASVDACKFVSHYCSSFTDYANGDCRKSPLFNEMGFNSEAKYSERTVYFLKVNSTSPFCMHCPELPCKNKSTAKETSIISVLFLLLSTTTLLKLVY